MPIIIEATYSKQLGLSNHGSHSYVVSIRTELTDILRNFTTRSAGSDVAVVYTTGHGVEVEGVVYLLPGDYPVSERNAALRQRAIRLSQLATAARGKTANLVFYGGCRDNPF